LIGLNQSIATFEQVRGTLLERYGIEIAEAGLGGPMRRASAAPETVRSADSTPEPGR